MTVLGFRADAVSRKSLEQRPSEFRQSDHPERYQQAFDRLREMGLLYGCTCTRAMMEATGSGERRSVRGRPRKVSRAIRPTSPTS